MKVYIDNMITKSVHATNHVRDLWITSQILKANHIKLNPNKCAFGVALGKFLRLIAQYHDIKANPNKIRAILEMWSPDNVKKV